MYESSPQEKNHTMYRYIDTFERECGETWKEGEREKEKEKW